MIEVKAILNDIPKQNIYIYTHINEKWNWDYSSHYVSILEKDILQLFTFLLNLVIINIF